jgi:hypothetical protein
VAGGRKRYGVKWTRKRRRDGHDDYFSVRANIGRLATVDRTPVELIDSAQFNPGDLDPEGFDAETRSIHGFRRRGDRSEKGRLFYVSAGGKAVAFIAFHAPPPDGGLIIENLVLDKRLAGREAAFVRRTLLCAALEASEAAGRRPNVLAWATNSDASADAVEKELGFSRVERPRNSDCELRSYLEREFPS